MNRWLILSVLVALIGSGCSEPETESPPPAPAAPDQRTTPAPIPSSAPTPVAPISPRTQVVTPRPARTESLAELLQQYQALAGRTTERSELITDVAALAGQRAKPEEVAGALGRMFSIETNPVLKSEILEELGALDHPSAINPILAALQAGQPTEVQADAADAVDTLLTDLAFSENAAMIEPISRALDSRYPSAVRQAAVSALEDLESPAAIPVLQRYLNDPDPEVREAAADAIEWLTE